MDQVTFYSFLVLMMVLLLPVSSHYLRRYPRLVRRINNLLLAVYLFANLYLTMLSRSADQHRRLMLEPFWSYTAALNGSALLAKEIILNILLYIPLGYLLHYAFPRLRWWQVILCGFLLSGLTETVQLVFKLGLCETDDLISNTLGTVIGVVLYNGYKSLMGKRTMQKIE